MLAASARIAAFFRDPERTVRPDENVLLSAADGTVLEIGGPLHTPNDQTQFVSVYLSLFDVHVIRAPCDGTVLEIDHHPGRHHSAKKKSSLYVNKRVEVTIKGAFPETILLTLTAGLVARQVKLSVGVGDAIKQGSRIGIIRFGSRATTSLPSCYDVVVSEGQTVRGGLSSVAKRSLGSY